MEHEGKSFRRRERFEHHLEREPDGIGKYRLLLRVTTILETDQ
jgi:hypothetical protein